MVPKGLEAGSQELSASVGDDDDVENGQRSIDGRRS
jgi:hypothetical protein